MRLRTFTVLVGSAFLAFALSAGAEAPSADASAAASKSAASGGSELQEIVVTARRSEESLQDVPISMSVLNQDDLDKRNITGTQDLGNYVPSLTVDNQFSGDAQSFSIRGFYQELASTPTVGVYFADAPEPRGGTIAGTTSGDGVGAGQLFDLQNIQVLKGPQGTLFGRNTTGGTILLVPAKPTGDFGGYIDVGAGNHGMDREQGVVNLPLADSVRMRLGFDRMQRDGWQNNISGIGPTHMNETNYYALRGSLVVDITPNLENYTVANFSVSDPTPGIDILTACNPSASQIPGYAPLIAASGACQAQVARQNSHSFDTVQNGISATYQYTRQWQVVNTTTWVASDATTIKNIASYSVFVNRYRGTIFGEYLGFNPSNPVFQPGGAFAAAGSSIAPGSQFIISDTSNAPGGNNADQRTVSEEIQVHARAFDSRLDLQGGLYAEVSDPLQPSVAGPVQAAACASTSPALCGDAFGAILTAAFGIYIPQGEYSKNTIGIHFHDYGVYSQASYKLLDNLTLTGGVRYTWDNMSGYSSLINFFFPQGFGAAAPSIGPVCFLPTTSTAINCSVASRSASSAPTGLVDLEYKPLDHVMLYAKYSRGYRQGGIQPRSAIPSYQPESVDAFEVGAKTSYGTDNIAGTFDMAAFYNKLNNQQLQVSYLVAGAFNQSLVNIGQSHVSGLEIDSAMRIYHALRLDVSAAYLHTEIVQIGNANAVGADLPAALQPFYHFASGPTLHAPLPNVPNWRVAVTGSYDLPVPTNYGDPSIGLTMVHTGEQFFTSQDGYTPPGGKQNYLPAITLLNANFDWHTMGGSPFDLAIFCTNLFDKNYITHYLGGYNATGFESGRQGEPRMFGARITYHFGAMGNK